MPKLIILIILTIAIGLQGCSGCVRSQKDTKQQQFFSEIVDMCKSGQMDKALELAVDYTQKHPTEDRGFLFLGNIYANLEQEKLAKKAYLKAITLNERNYQALTGLGVLARQRGDYLTAVDYYFQALKVNSDYAQAYSSIAVIEMHRGNNRSALALARQAYKIDPADATIAANLAVACHYNGLIKQRDQMVQKARQLGYENLEKLKIIFAGDLSIRDIDNPQQELQTIASLYMQGDLDQSRQRLELYVQHYPNNDLAWTILGNICQDAGELKQAEQAYTKAVTLNKRNFQAYTGLGILARERQNYRQARTYYRKALAINPNYAQANISLAIIELKQKKYRRALQYAEKGYDLDPSDPVIVANLALIYHYNERYSDRDQMLCKAKQLGYPEIEQMEKLFYKK